MFKQASTASISFQVKLLLKIEINKNKLDKSSYVCNLSIIIRILDTYNVTPMLETKRERVSPDFGDETLWRHFENTLRTKKWMYPVLETLWRHCFSNLSPDMFWRHFKDIIWLQPCLETVWRHIWIHFVCLQSVFFRWVLTWFEFINGSSGIHVHHDIWFVIDLYRSMTTLTSIV